MNSPFNPFNNELRYAMDPISPYLFLGRLLYVFILAVVLAVIVMIIEIYKGEKMSETETEKLGVKINWIGIIVLVIIIGFVGIGFCSVIADNRVVNQTTFNSISKQPIASLSDTSVLGGHFFLGIGSISDEPYFYYYAKDGNSYHIGRVPADRTNIIMDEEKDPYLLTLTPKEKTCHGNGQCDIYQTWAQDTYELHVPEGTIQKQFILNGV